MKELRIKVASEEQFGISFKGAFKKIFENKGYFGNFSREHGNTDPLGASYMTFFLSQLFVIWSPFMLCKDSYSILEK